MHPLGEPQPAPRSPGSSRPGLGTLSSPSTTWGDIGARPQERVLPPGLPGTQSRRQPCLEQMGKGQEVCRG